MSNSIYWKYIKSPDINLEIGTSETINSVKDLEQTNIDLNKPKERANKKLIKIVLILLTIVIIFIATIVLLKWNFIIDYLTNPTIVLKVNEVNIEVGDTLDLASLYDNPKELDVKYREKNNKPFSTNILGRYIIVYKITTNSGTHYKEVLINVKDTTKPILVLKDNVVTINSSDVTKFNALNYIKEYYDNYDNSSDLILEYSNELNINNNKAVVVYTITDKSGNISKVMLNVVVIKDNNEDISSTTIISSESLVPTTQSISIENTTQPIYTTQNNTSNTESATSPNSRQFIKGVKNHTIKSGEIDYSELEIILTSSVSGSSEITVDYSEVNLSIPGIYYVYYISEDGISEVAIITITD